MTITFDGVKLVYNKQTYDYGAMFIRLFVDDMIAVASSKSKEIMIHSLPRIAEGWLVSSWLCLRSSRSLLEEIEDCVRDKYLPVDLITHSRGASFGLADHYP